MNSKCGDGSTLNAAIILTLSVTAAVAVTVAAILLIIPVKQRVFITKRKYAIIAALFAEITHGRL